MYKTLQLFVILRKKRDEIRRLFVTKTILISYEGRKKTVKNGDHAPLSGLVKWPVWSPFEGASERVFNAFMPYGKNLWSNMIITCQLIKFRKIKSTYT